MWVFDPNFGVNILKHQYLTLLFKLHQPFSKRFMSMALCKITNYKFLKTAKGTNLLQNSVTLKYKSTVSSKEMQIETKKNIKTCTNDQKAFLIIQTNSIIQSEINQTSNTNLYESNRNFCIDKLSKHRCKNIILSQTPY